MRNKAIVSQVKQRLILTALDRKEAGLKHNSKRALAPIKTKTVNRTGLARTRRARKVRTSNSLNQNSLEQNSYGSSYQKPVSSIFDRPDFLEPYIAPSYGQVHAPMIEPIQPAKQENFSYSQNANFPEHQPTNLPPKMVCVGTVTQYISKINVAIIMLSGTLKQGDTIAITGENFLSFQKVEEIQIDREPVPFAQKGDHIGLKVTEPAVTNGKIYRFHY